MGSHQIDITCPCCETKLQIDVKTGEVVCQEKKAKEFGSLADMVKDLDSQRKENETLFRKQSEIQKDRKRLLDEKFKEAQKHVDRSSNKPLRDFDLD